MLAEIETVDLISHTDEGYFLTLVIDAGEWRLPRAKWLLQEKLNAYAVYALDGQMHRMYPDSVGKPVSIIICYADPIPSDIARFIDQIAAILAKEGLTVTVEPLPTAEAA